MLGGGGGCVFKKNKKIKIKAHKADIRPLLKSRGEGEGSNEQIQGWKKAKKKHLKYGCMQNTFQTLGKAYALLKAH